MKDFNHSLPSEESIVKEKMDATGIVFLEGKRDAFKQYNGCMSGESGDQDYCALQVRSDREEVWSEVVAGKVTKNYALGYDNAAAEIHLAVIGEEISESPGQELESEG